MIPFWEGAMDLFKFGFGWKEQSCCPSRTALASRSRLVHTYELPKSTSTKNGKDSNEKQVQ
jgi:hypothetical protein